jgi:hypothetical protein
MGIMSHKGAELYMHNMSGHAPYVVDYYKNILKQHLPAEPPRVANKKFKVRFGDGMRDTFHNFLKTALSDKKWEIPFVSEK